MINNSSVNDNEYEEGSSKKKEAAPPPKKKKKSKEAKDKDYELEFFFGGILQIKSVHVMCLYNKYLILILLKDLHQQILNHCLGGKLMQHAILP